MARGSAREKDAGGLPGFTELTFGQIMGLASGVDDDAKEALADVVRAVRASGRKGSVTVTAKVEERNSTTHELGVQFTIRASPPNLSTIHSFHSDEKGHVSKAPQRDLFDPEGDSGDMADAGSADSGDEHGWVDGE